MFCVEHECEQTRRVSPATTTDFLVCYFMFSGFLTSLVYQCEAIGYRLGVSMWNPKRTTNWNLQLW